MSCLKSSEDADLVDMDLVTQPDACPVELGLADASVESKKMPPRAICAIAWEDGPGAITVSACMRMVRLKGA